MQKIIPSLWFDKNCEEAMNFYVSVFKNSKIISIKRYPEGMDEGPMKGMGGKVLNGIIADQAEVDYYWEKLSAHPENEQCGWVKDKFGISWQIVPKRLGELIGSSDREKANRALQAMLKMKKIDIAALEAAYNG
jgi:predicted 3-demethylubiquinone-9 3-methyltransferase (glyoxalase superfamily)